MKKHILLYLATICSLSLHAPPEEGDYRAETGNPSRSSVAERTRKFEQTGRTFRPLRPDEHFSDIKKQVKSSFEDTASEGIRLKPNDNISELFNQLNLEGKHNVLAPLLERYQKLLQQNNYEAANKFSDDIYKLGNEDLSTKLNNYIAIIHQVEHIKQNLNSTASKNIINDLATKYKQAQIANPEKAQNILNIVKRSDNTTLWAQFNTRIRSAPSITL